MKKLTVVAALVAALATFAAVPGVAVAAAAADAPVTNQVHDVAILLDGEPIMLGGIAVNKDAKVPAGSDLKIRSVPNDAKVYLQTGPEFSEQLPLEASTTQIRTWVYSSLPPSHRFWVRVLAADGSTAMIRFSTGAAQSTFGGSIHPVPDATRCKNSICKYGVGIPVRIEFDMPIADKYKAGVEAALDVKSSKPIGASSWAWLSDSVIGFRPRNYWPAYAKVSVQANLAGVQGASGVWGTDFSMKFTTGAKLVLRTRIDDYTMVVFENDKKIKTFPISSGSSGLDTTSGIKVISEKYGYNQKVLRNPDPKNGWEIRVAYAIRITWDGEFLHSAPWNYSLGEANLSHGCTNMSIADSKWVYDNTRMGDVVEANGSPVKAANDDVYGYWNYSWSQWRGMSALTSQN